jgi:TRAP-type C4-dicarboxylate transport system permease small subunit
MEAIRSRVDKVLAAVSIGLFVVLLVVVCWQVLSRQVLQTPAAWTEETARYLFVILALLSASLVFSERGHIAVEILAARFPPPVQKAIAVLVEFIVIFFALYVLVLGGYRVAENSWNQGLSAIPVWVSVGQMYLVLPVAGVLITFYSLCHLRGLLRGTTEPVPEGDVAALDV